MADQSSSALSMAMQSLFRSIVLGITAALAGRGFLTQDMAEIYAASVPPILMAAWGVWNAYRTERDALARETVAVQTGVKAERTGLINAALPAENIGPDHAQALIQAVKEDKDR